MSVTSVDFNRAFDFIEPAVKAIISAGAHDGFHIMAFTLDINPIVIAERAYGEPGKAGRNYRFLASQKAEESAMRKMSIQDFRVIDPEHLERLRLHDGSTVDTARGFGLASAGVGSAANIAFVELSHIVALRSMMERLPETIAAE